MTPCCALTIQTGLRISELAALTRQDVTLTAHASVHTIGKGRKERRTPLVASTKAILHAWLSECPGAPSDPLFPTITGRPLSGDAIEHRLAHHVALARPAPIAAEKAGQHAYPASHHRRAASTLRRRRSAIIALWLGHERIATTDITCTPDVTHKRQAIDRTEPHQPRHSPTHSSRSWRRSDYADLNKRDSLCHSHNHTNIGITRRSA